MCEKTNSLGSDKVRHKPGCTVTEDGLRLEILDLESRGIVFFREAKTKALISFAVTAKLICACVFAYADCWFSHVAAQITSGDYLPSLFSLNPLAITGLAHHYHLGDLTFVSGA